MSGASRQLHGGLRDSLPAVAGLAVGLALGVMAIVMLGIPRGQTPVSLPSPPQPPAIQPEAEARPRLVGLKGSAIRLTFGEPEMRRRELPAEVWQYRTPRCVLDLYFYGDPDGEGVVHVESRPRDSRQGSAASPEDCVGELVARRRSLI